MAVSICNLLSMQSRTLRSHREALASNPDAYTADLPRLQETAVAHLKRFGFTKVTSHRCPDLINEFVAEIFEAQDMRPFFHIDAALPFCWNAPKDWNRNYIRYEWGHLRSRNQNENAHHIENICLQSARCNQHVQTSMDITEVMEWLRGSPVATRAELVLAKRRSLFASERWRVLLVKLGRYR